MSDAVFTYKPNPAVKQQVHAAALGAVQEVFELDVLPEAQRLSPVSDENPQIPGTKYKYTGHNRRSLDVDVQDSPEGPRAELFGQSGYSGYLEVGTSKMPPRPYMYPALQRMIDRIGPAFRHRVVR